jgi:hypothetical protein
MDEAQHTAEALEADSDKKHVPCDAASLQKSSAKAVALKVSSR